MQLEGGARGLPSPRDGAQDQGKREGEGGESLTPRKVELAHTVLAVTAATVSVPGT